MRVFPRINYRRLGSRGGRRPHKSRGPNAGRASAGPQTLLLTIPPLLLAATLLAHLYAGPGALLLLASAATLFAAVQGVALRRLSRRRPLQLSLQEGEDRRFLLDLSGGVRAASNVVQLYEQVAGKIAREFRVDSEGKPCDKLDLGGPVLGIFEGFRYEQGAVRLRQGDVFVGYTDGVVEALDARGEEFGERRLRDCVAESFELTAEEICACAVRRVDEWCANTPQHDDLTLVVLKVK